ncbi:MAG: hypothetical protein AB8G23_06230 [Myxococcota bacterium]
MTDEKGPEESGPLLHPDHPRPRTRREFLGQGFLTGAAYVAAPSVLSMLGAKAANAQASCSLSAGGGAGKVPFIGIDLAGGANIAGSNVMVGGPGGQEDPLSESGYSRLGLPLDMTPLNSAITAIDRSLNLAFHFDSAMLQGILSKASLATLAKVDGVITPSRSSNDTGNNPLNPIYGIHRAGAQGALLPLIGSQSSESGGNSLSPMSMIVPEARPTKIDRPSDARGLVDTGRLTDLLGAGGAGNVAEAIRQISALKVEQINEDAAVKELVNCAYQQSSDLISIFGDPSLLDPESDPLIRSDNPADTPILTANELNQSEFRKTASIMKLVLEGHAGAGTMTFGGYDYHDGTRTRGESKDFRVGECIGTILEYAERNPSVDNLMIYLFSDGSVFSDGQADGGANGKGVWRGDNSSTACSVMLVYQKSGKPRLATAYETTRQVGHFRSTGTVETDASAGGNSASNNPEALAQMVALNYMALHGEEGNFMSTFPGNALASDMSDLIAFDALD